MFTWTLSALDIFTIRSTSAFASSRERTEPSGTIAGSMRRLGKFMIRCPGKSNEPLLTAYCLLLTVYWYCLLPVNTAGRSTHYPVIPHERSECRDLLSLQCGRLSGNEGRSRHSL